MYPDQYLAAIWLPLHSRHIIMCSTSLPQSRACLWLLVLWSFLPLTESLSFSHLCPRIAVHLGFGNQQCKLEVTAIVNSITARLRKIAGLRSMGEWKERFNSLEVWHFVWALCGWVSSINHYKLELLISDWWQTSVLIPTWWYMIQRKWT